MKKILTFFVLVSSFCFSEEIGFELPPFWSDEAHAKKYHELMVEESLNRIEKVIQSCEASKIDPYIKIILIHELTFIKFHLDLN